MGLPEYFSELNDVVSAERYPRRLADQVYVALCKNWVSAFDEITTLPKSLREELTTVLPGFFPEIVEVTSSRDCRKLLLKLSDGELIETVVLSNSKGEATVCVSCQAGCPLNCVFCATGAEGFRRNLSHWEIAYQAFAAAAMARADGQRLTNVVVMGMGEPFLNFDNVIKALRLLNDPKGLALGARKISVSTGGMLKGIHAFAKLPEQFNLAISLHSPFNEERRRLMPVSKGYKVGELIREATGYVQKTGRKLFFEYLLLRDVNTSPDHLKALALLLKHPLFHINLISYNSGAGDFQGVNTTEAQAIAGQLVRLGAKVTVRRSMGRGINAACGQLRAKATDQENA